MPLFLAVSCIRTKTIIVQPEDVMQIKDPVKAAVWVFDQNGKRVDGGIVTIPAGWYVVYDNDKEEPNVRSK